MWKQYPVLAIISISAKALDSKTNATHKILVAGLMCTSAKLLEVVALLILLNLLEEF